MHILCNWVYNACLVKKELTAILNYIKLHEVIRLMALYTTQKDDNCIFNNNQDRWGISYPSEHL